MSSDVVPLDRDEYQWLRSHIFSAESEVTALRKQYRRAIQIMRWAIKAHEANDPIGMAGVVEDMRVEVMGE